MNTILNPTKSAPIALTLCVVESASTEPVVNNNAEKIIGLRALANFLEANPSFPAVILPKLYVCTSSKESLTKVAAMLGNGKKSVDPTYYNITREFPGGLVLEAFTQRDNVCTKIQTGTAIVKEKQARSLTPEEEAIRDQFMKIELYEDVEVEKPVFEWKCPDSLLALAS